jgi:hypothetical protein
VLSWACLSAARAGCRQKARSHDLFFVSKASPTGTQTHGANRVVGNQPCQGTLSEKRGYLLNTLPFSKFCENYAVRILHDVTWGYRGGGGSFVGGGEPTKPQEIVRATPAKTTAL